jgi:arylsulfatase
MKTALRLGDWKLVRSKGGPRARQSSAWELYDLSRDISESTNLATDHPEKIAELRAAWEKLDSEMVPPLF